MLETSTNSRLVFGLFELDEQTGELWKAGFRIKLQNQPTRLLLLLLEHPGRVVPREELQQRIWGRDMNVDFDHSLGTAVNKIREALGDSAENPRFVETLARRGYRFIAPVHRTGGSQAGPGAAEAAPAPPTSEQALEALPRQTLKQQPAPVPPPLAAPAPPPLHATAPAQTGALASKPRLWLWSATGVLVLMALTGWAAYLLGRQHREQLPVHILQLTHDGHLTASVVTMENLAETATDGVRLYATTSKNGQGELAAISLPGGSVAQVDLPDEVASPALGAISPDGSRLLLRNHLSPESEQPLWIVPTAGGSALRVGNALAHDATWMPDGKRVLYANDKRLLVTGADGSNPENPEVYATLPGRAFWLRWSPDASLLRFTIIDPLAHTMELWQLSPKDRKPVRLLNDLSAPASACCGVWTHDGRWFVFQSSEGDNTDLWRLRGNSTSGRERVTDGPLQFQSPVASQTGNRIYFLGANARSELDHLGANGELVPDHSFLADAMRVEYARGGQRVTWTDGAGRLWCARSNGSERLQLTPDSLDVFMARWSPDGTHLAVMARAPGKAWNIYLVAADGSDLHPLVHEARNAADPSWSPDGQRIVFGRTNDEMGKENARSLELFDLRTGATSTVPGSDGLFSPRWSPDGRYLVALTLDQRHAELFNVALGSWRTLPVPSAADPVWSPDSRSLFIHASLSPGQPVLRLSMPEGRVDAVTPLGGNAEANAVDFVLIGLAADGAPLIRTRMYTGDLFAVDLPKD